MAVHVIYVGQTSQGYYPVEYMAHLAAKYLDGQLTFIRGGRPSKLARIRSLLPQKRDEDCGLLICPHPDALVWALSTEDWRKRCGRLVAWVFDSFWACSVPRLLAAAKAVDHVFVTEREDLGVWRDSVRAPVEWLPWGSDVLGLGSANSLRPIDVLRVGRQPQEWEDDASNARECGSIGLTYGGRPGHHDGVHEGMKYLMGVFGSAKYTLSFSNRVSRAQYTHPKREYITGRWTDALAAGAIVAGVPPDCETISALFWDGALLDLGTTDRKKGLAIISEAERGWTAARAQQNYRKSLELLDWRWRFERIAKSLDLRPPLLEADLGRLRDLASA